jgi:curli biogenesis system outer membrane secretion channel CsgG
VFTLPTYNIFRFYICILIEFVQLGARSTEMSVAKPIFSKFSESVYKIEICTGFGFDRNRTDFVFRFSYLDPDLGPGLKFVN